MKRTLLLLLLLLLCGVVWAERSLRFVVTAEPVHQISYYTDSKLHSRVAHAYAGASASLEKIDWMPASAGERALLHIYGVPHAKISGQPQLVSLSPQGSNPLWPRWRSAWLSNMTLLFASETMHEELLAESPERKLRVKCRPNQPEDFCVVETPIQAKVGSHSGEYRLVINPEKRRGTLPAFLYMMLTDGRDIVDPLGMHHEDYLAAKASNDCVHLSIPGNEEITICADDVDPAFQFSSDNTTIELGGAFWWPRYAATAIDGWTGEIIALEAAHVHPAVLIIGALASFISTIVIYGRWASGPDTLTVAAAFVQLYFPGKAAFRYHWPFDFRAVIGACFLTPAIAVTLTTAWVGYRQVRDALLPPLLGPTCEALLIIVTVYASIQYVLATVLLIKYDLHVLNIDGFSLHYIPTPIAWIRHLVQGTTATACSTLAFIPFALNAGFSGDRIFMIVLVVPIMLTLVQHAYYAIPILGLSIRAIVKRPSNRASIVFVIAIGEILLLLAYAAAIGWFYLSPLVSASSPLFGDVHNLLAVAYLLTVAITGGILVGMFEVVAVIRRMKKIVQLTQHEKTKKK